MLSQQRKYSPMSDVTVVEAPARRLPVLAHRGPYPEIGPVFGAMFGHAGKAGLMPRVEAMIGVCMDEPNTVAPADPRAFAGVALPEDAECPPAWRRRAFLAAIMPF